MSPLLRLPRELRDKIYRLLLVVEQHKRLTSRFSGDSKRRRHATMRTANGTASEVYDGTSILRANK